MTHEHGAAAPTLPAGNFSSWLSGMRSALKGERPSEVPCGDCSACCRSSQFVHIGPEETDTLAHIPRDLRFPAPGLPEGHVVLGYDQNGHCPMLDDDRCSIYEHRPRTCRTYDCRVFPAAGIDIEQEKPLIARRAHRWRFAVPTEVDGLRHAAVRAAAAFLREHRARLPEGVIPADPTQVAVAAVEVHDVFLRFDEATGRTVVVSPEPEVVEAALRRRARGRGV